ncbi:MAG: alpha/beta hydrolase [Gammaproteobacteria bacterium]|nr:alpha/beta hydrolase [Gammaproteobacteria bacterium]
MKPVIRIITVGLALLLAGCTLGPSLPDGAHLEEQVIYIERDQGPLAGRLFVPPGKGPHPTVLLVHGGGWRGGSPRHMDHIGRLLAREGLLAFSPGYRFAPDAVHPAQLVDIREAWNWLAQRDDVDPRNMAAWGYSAGAHLALLLGLAPEAEGGPTDGPRPIAIVGGGSPTRLDLFDPDGRLLVNLLGGTRDEMPERWESASPITWVTPDDPPVYLYHGSDDDVVSPEHSEELASALQEAGVPVVLDQVPGGHISVALLDRDVERRAAGFIRQQLRDSEGMFDDEPVQRDLAP